MEQQAPQRDDSDNESDDKPKKHRLKWRYVFDWGFWSGHPLAVITLFLGGIFLASITGFPGGNPRHLWYFAFGLWLVIGAAIWWVAGSIIARLEGRELLTAQEIAEREQAYRDRIQARLDSLETGVTGTQKQLAGQQPRRITKAQRDAIKAHLAEFAGQKFIVYVSIFDPEASQYAQDFIIAFIEAGWEYVRMQNATLPGWFGPVSVGLGKEGLDATPKEIPPAAIRTINVLTSLGLCHTYEGKDVTIFNDLAPDIVGICISPRVPVSGAVEAVYRVGD